MSDFPQPSLTVDALVLAGEGPAMQVLLIERGHEPYAGRFALPGGFVDAYEPPWRAVIRELEEETGLSLPETQGMPLSLRGRKGRDPRGWTVSQPSLFWLPEPRAVQAGDDARKAFWVPLEELDVLAFDHGAILCEALGKFWEPMPERHPALQGIRGFGVPARFAREIIFYGGSFNPWHQGHSACVSLCPKDVSLVVVPDTNPAKSSSSANYCYWQHYQHIRHQVHGPEQAVFPGYCGSERPNPTVCWFPHVVSPKKGLLCGDDQFVAFHSWIEADSLAEAIDHLLVVPRRESAAHRLRAQAWFQAQNPACRISRLPDHPHRHLSATAFRQGKPPS